jgi:hypothetical protein
MQTDSQWLDEGTARIGDIVRESMAHGSWMVGAFH